MTWPLSEGVAGVDFVRFIKVSLLGQGDGQHRRDHALNFKEDSTNYRTLMKVKCKVTFITGYLTAF